MLPRSTEIPYKPPMNSYDLVIVGSGPAGSAAAVTAAQLGLSCALIDKARFPRDKLCGGLFTGRSEKALGQIFGLSITQDIFLTSDHMRFLASGKVLADIPNAPPVHLTMRCDLDKLLHDRALSAGVTPYLGHPITELSEDTITLRGGTTVGYKVLIGADGVNSFIARSLFGRPFDPETIGFGLEIETPRAPARDMAVEVDFDAARWGYGWAFPKSQSVTVGVGGIKSENAMLKQNMSDYVALTGSDESLRYKGQYLPFGDYKKQPGQRNIMLAGDAAGLVDPITGEGIALAMESGAFAAQAAHAALQADAPNSAFGHYLKAVKPIHKSLDQARMWRMVMFPDATQGYFKKAFARGSALQMKYLELLSGEADYNDLRGALLRRLPKLAWRMARHKLGLPVPK